MRIEKKHVLLPIVAATIGFAAGLLFPRDSERIRGLTRELEARNREVSSSPQIALPFPASRPPSPGGSATSSGASETTNAPQVEKERYEKERYKSIHEAWIARTASEGSEEYSAVLSRLGLTGEEIERFQSELIVLHGKAIEAGSPLRNLADARHKYDQTIKAALGEENYKVYRDYEISKPARRELELINAFATKSGGNPIDDANAESVLRIIAEARATTTENWHGPYDPLPRPIVGFENVTESINNHIRDMSAKAREVVQIAQKNAMGDDVIALLQTYYAKVLVDYTQSLPQNFNPGSIERARALLERTKRKP